MSDIVKNFYNTLKIQFVNVITIGFGITGLFSYIIKFIIDDFSNTNNSYIFIIISFVSYIIINLNIKKTLQFILEVFGFSLMLVPIVYIIQNFNIDLYNFNIVINILFCIFTSLIILAPVHN